MDSARGRHGQGSPPSVCLNWCLFYILESLCSRVDGGYSESFRMGRTRLRLWFARICTTVGTVNLLICSGPGRNGPHSPYFQVSGYLDKLKPVTDVA